MSKKDDLLYLLIIPINLFYYYSYKYLYDKNKLSRMVGAGNKGNS
jgi:hypothetical protein